MPSLQKFKKFFISLADHIQEYFMNLDPQQRRQKMSKMIKPHETLPNKWSCLVCNEIFSRRESAKDHFEGRHLRMYSYECQFCSKMFTCGSQRRAHIHLRHREENRLTKLMNE